MEGIPIEEDDKARTRTRCTHMERRCRDCGLGRSGGSDLDDTHDSPQVFETLQNILVVAFVVGWAASRFSNLRQNFYRRV